MSGQISQSWPPISKEELELKDNPQHPGDNAIVLYREVQTDNVTSVETHRERIKILKDAGKKYADVEIPYFENDSRVEDVQARTVAPDGHAANFNGIVYDKVVAKTRRLRLNVKTFTLPDVQSGSIVEYSYSLHLHRNIPDVLKHPENYLINRRYAYPAARWPVQGRLFVRQAHFVLHPFSAHIQIAIRSVRLPHITPPQQQQDGTLQLDVENVPGLVEEEYSPPEEAVKGEMCLYYVIGYFSNDGYWSDLGQLEFEQLEKFFSKSKVIHQEAFRLIDPKDAPEATLRKLYERVQMIRAISFEPAKTEKERERENLKPNKTAEEVLTHNYAFANDINNLFVALAREAGFQSYPVRVTSRNRNFFLNSLPDPGQLDAEVVEVVLPDKTIFVDPATLHCPFGLLPWEETGTHGIRLDRLSTGVVNIPGASSEDAVIERNGSFRLDKDGTLSGTLEVNFLGQEALVRRIDEHNHDQAGRKQHLEEEVKKWLPQNATTKLTSVSGWDGSNGALHAVFEVEAPNFAARTGDRLFLPAVLFRPELEKAFQPSSRENPVYLQYGHQERDELILELPQGYKAESLPAPGGRQTQFASYKRSTEQQGTGLKLKSTFIMDGYFFSVNQYPELRTFFRSMRTNSEEQTVLRLTPGI